MFLPQHLIGDHKVVINRIGHASLTEMVTIDENKTSSYNFELSNMCNITFKTNAPNAEIVIGDYEKHALPVQKIMPGGKHKIKIVADGYKPFEGVVEIDGSAPEMMIELECVRSSVTVKANKYGSVYVNNHYKGSIPKTFDLDYGDYLISCKGSKSYG